MGEETFAVTPETAKEFENLTSVLQLAQAQSELAQTRAQAIADQRNAILRTAMRELGVPSGYRYDPAQGAFIAQPVQPDHTHE